MSIRLGRILGIPIKIDASWLIIFGLIVYTLAVGYFPRFKPNLGAPMNWLGGVIAALLLFGSVLLHELMHSYVAKKNRLPVGGITLFIFGGVSELTEEPETPGLELKMAIAGPATSIVLGILLLVAARLGGIATFGELGLAIVGYLGGINLALGVFNLIPGFPLDGGRVLRAILWGSMHDIDKATRIASGVGQGFGYLFIAGGFLIMLSGQFLSGLWLIFIGWFLNNAAHQSYQMLVLKRALSGVEVSRVMMTDYPHIAPHTTLDEFAEDYLLKYDYRAYPVSEDDRLLGIVTVDEVRGIPREQWATTTVGTVAKPPEQELVIDENDDAFDALMRMARGNLRGLLVMHEGKFEGMVTQESIMNLVRAKLQLGIS
ncbi:MAG: site-2 protease family protein [Armatimonadota bacterium]|nr:site-2 protease family protein [Armatimonadota bacterium]